MSEEYKAGRLKNGNKAVPIQLSAWLAPRCGAKSKRTGQPCRAMAMKNGRCYFHGGKSTGPRTPEGLERMRQARLKHGRFTKEAVAERRRQAAERAETNRAIKELRDTGFLRSR